MKRLTIFLLSLVLFFPRQVFGQYQDFVCIENYIYALTNDGKINLFDKTTGLPANENIKHSSKILCITLDRSDVLTIADSTNQVLKYDKNRKTFTVAYSCKNTPKRIIFDSKNNPFSTCEYGIEDLKTNKIYFSSPKMFNNTGKWFKEPCCFIDKEDNVWLGFGFGEWGGALLKFNIPSLSYANPFADTIKSYYLWPVQSIFSDNKSIYLSCGLNHFFTSGRIIKIDKSVPTVLLNSDTEVTNVDTNTNARKYAYGEYIGPGTFSQHNNCVYFYSQNGIFIGDKDKDLSLISNWKNIPTPKLSWSDGQPDAVGAPMNVIKFSIFDKTSFAILSASNGILVYNGKDFLTIN